MTETALWQMHNGLVDLVEILEAALGGRVVAPFLGIVFDQTGQLRPVLLEFPPHHELDQGQEADCDTQQVGKADDLVILTDEEGVDGG